MMTKSNHHIALPRRLSPFFRALLVGFWMLSVPATLVTGHAQTAPTTAVAGLLPGERLVPVTPAQRLDKAGNAWQFEEHGAISRVGNSLLNNGMNLNINNRQFYTQQPMANADGEWVLVDQNSVQQGLQIVRRIKLLEDVGVVRYVDVFTNLTSNGLGFQVNYKNNTSNNFQSVMSDQGNSGVTELSARESGVIVTPSSSQSTRAFLYGLSSPKSLVKPAIVYQNRYAFEFQYSLQVPAGGSVALLSAVRQVPVPRGFQRKDLATLFRPALPDRLLSGLPAALRSLVVNVKTGGTSGPESLLGGIDTAALGVERGRRDVLAISGDTRLVGDALGGGIRIEGEYGAADIPFSQIAAIEGANLGKRDAARVFLRTGEIFSGQVVSDGLQFQMASGGKVDLDLPSLDRLVLAEKEGDGDWSRDGSEALVETHSGDRIALSNASGVTFQGMSPWGKAEFPLSDLVWLAPVEDEPVGYIAELADGTRTFLFLGGGKLATTTKWFGPREIELSAVKSIVTRLALERNQQRKGAVGTTPAQAVQPLDSPQTTYANLTGGQRIVGPVQNETFTVLTQGGKVSVKPEEIRRLVNLVQEDATGGATSAEPNFRIELWGGGVITGPLEETSVAFRKRGLTWNAPIGDVVELVNPQPTVAEGVRQEIARLVRQLGAEEWQVREEATRGLEGYGYLARALLLAELGTSTDPEVRRRIERILERLEE